MKNQKGFTLIELLVVVVIIGILAAVALPKLFSAICTSKQGAADGMISATNSASTLYFGEMRGAFPNVSGYTNLQAATPTWFTKYYEGTDDPFGKGKFVQMKTDGDDYTVCFEYAGGVGCDGVDQTSATDADDVVYFGSRKGVMVTGHQCP